MWAVAHSKNTLSLIPYLLALSAPHSLHPPTHLTQLRLAARSLANSPSHSPLCHSLARFLTRSLSSLRFSSLLVSLLFSPSPHLALFPSLCLSASLCSSLSLSVALSLSHSLFPLPLSLSLGPLFGPKGHPPELSPGHVFSSLRRRISVHLHSTSRTPRRSPILPCTGASRAWVSA